MPLAQSDHHKRRGSFGEGRSEVSLNEPFIPGRVPSSFAPLHSISWKPTHFIHQLHLTDSSKSSISHARQHMMPAILLMHRGLHFRAYKASDNNDFCSACGGPGYLLCCDGCDRSFHFTCLDPPVNPEADVDQDWYCSSCCARPEEVPKRRAQGLFSDLHDQVESNNPRSFILPDYIRHFFAGIRTGAGGEYISHVVDQKPSTYVCCDVSSLRNQLHI